MDKVKITLNFWGSGMMAMLVMATSMVPVGFIEKDSAAQILGYMLVGFIVAPILGGAAQHWFWKDHDWLGVSK